MENYARQRRAFRSLLSTLSVRARPAAYNAYPGDLSDERFWGRYALNLNIQRIENPVNTYLATEPKPGQLSVMARSLSTVFGIPIQAKG